MKTRLTALALAGVMLVALAACGGTDAGDVQPAPDPSQSVTDLPEESVTPSPIPSEGTPAPLDSTDAPGALGPDSDAPSAEPTPSAIGDPTAPPSEVPSEAPAASVTAAEVYTAVARAAGVSYDNSTDYIDAFYTTLSTGDMDDYVLYQPSMSTQIEEIFLAKVKSGKMDTVKAACRDRQAALAEQAAFYATTGTYVDSYQLVSEGDWVLFCVCEKSSDAVSAFRSSVK